MLIGFLFTYLARRLCSTCYLYGARKLSSYARAKGQSIFLDFPTFLLLHYSIQGLFRQVYSPRNPLFNAVKIRLTSGFAPRPPYPIWRDTPLSWPVGWL